ncbi:hypothetical protein FZC79_02515 [Rossellomorea vietnamensis]|uniref:Uncharacterized protein n=2 Tax=Rossellomorea TaxID=2837508 RepID=A0A5D4KKS1_9BACI|nr:hypothetical protein FZC79_02515 [Rossellomorea vietnamensis]TYS83499.1 hypothetical protein FZC80_03820 [Rossellomorea aquimaris]
MLYKKQALGEGSIKAVKNKSGSASFSPNRQMFSKEKKAVFPFILLRLFDPEGLGAAAGRG